jgi:aspartokinase-like uncharacterized kinase
MRGHGSGGKGLGDSSPTPRRVIKLGGSLFADTEWVNRFRRWLTLQPLMSNILIGGGGALADVVREWDRDYRLDAEVAHWLAIDAMSMTAQLAARLLPEGNWTDSWQTLLTFESHNQVLIFDSRRWLHDEEAHAEGVKLSHSWDTTSDSIAARIAELLGCAELVLLKSCLPSNDAHRLADLAAERYVDANFPFYAGQIPTVRCVNLRDSDFPERRFSP